MENDQQPSRTKIESEMVWNRATSTAGYLSKAPAALMYKKHQSGQKEELSGENCLPLSLAIK